MEYRKIIKIDFMKYEKCVNKGKVINNNIRLSNSNIRFDKHFNTPHFKKTIGLLSFDDFKDSHFVYKIEKNKSEHQSSMFELELFLSNIQTFITTLWFIKDNSVSAEDGFIYVVDNKKDISISVNSRTVSFTNARGEKNIVEFTEAEIEEAIEIYRGINQVYEVTEKLIDSKEIIFENLEFKVNRIERFLYLLQATRNESYMPMRIALYTTMLETLLSTSKGNLAHFVSSRLACLIAIDGVEKKEIFRFVKRMYNIRSSVLHGDKLSK